jgi:hypothetical protein
MDLWLVSAAWAGGRGAQNQSNSRAHCPLLHIAHKHSGARRCPPVPVLGVSRTDVRRPQRTRPAHAAPWSTWISRTGVSLRPAVRSACSSLRPGPPASKSKRATQRQRQRHGHRARARRPFSICPALSTWPSPPGLAVRSYISTDPCNMQSPGQARTARRRTPTQHAATNSTRPSLHAGGHARVVCYCYEHCVTFAT